MNNDTSDFPEVSVRPSMLNQANKILLGITITGVGIPVSEWAARESGKDIILETFAAFLFIGCLFFTNVIWTAFNQRFCLCQDYLASYSGLLGTSLRTTRLLYEHVRGVEIEQSLIQRMLGLGDLHVGSDVNKGEGEMVICGIKAPDKLKDFILERVRETTHVKLQNESSHQHYRAYGVLRGL